MQPALLQGTPAHSFFFVASAQGSHSTFSCATCSITPSRFFSLSLSFPLCLFEPEPIAEPVCYVRCRKPSYGAELRIRTGVQGLLVARKLGRASRVARRVLLSGMQPSVTRTLQVFAVFAPWRKRNVAGKFASIWMALQRGSLVHAVYSNSQASSEKPNFSMLFLLSPFIFSFITDDWFEKKLYNSTRHINFHE